MAGKITALEAQKRARERVNVYLDGEFAFGLSLALAMSLKVGDVLTDEDIARLQAADAVERAREYALTLLDHRPRSEAELRGRLKQKGFADSAIDAVIERLRQVGLVDDLAFARFWAEQRQRAHERGRALLRAELRLKGIPDAIIEQVCADYDETEALRQAAREQLYKLRHVPEAEQRQRLVARLMRRGFSYTAINDLLHDPTFAFPHSDESEDL